MTEDDPLWLREQLKQEFEEAYAGRFAAFSAGVLLTAVLMLGGLSIWLYGG